MAPKCVGDSLPKSLIMLVLLRRSFSYVILGVFIWIYLNPRNFNPRNFNFLVGFSFKTIFAPPRPITTLVSKDVEFSCASFDLYEKFARWCPPTQTPTRKFKTGISIFSSQGMGSTLVSLRMIFKALQSELFRLKFHFLESKLQKIPEFNLVMSYDQIILIHLIKIWSIRSEWSIC